MDDDPNTQDPAQEPAPANIFIAPSIHAPELLAGESYTHHSAIPPTIAADPAIECVLGIDEAGRGPVLGPMVYGLLYLPLAQHRSLLAQTHRFDDSKVLTPAARSSLFAALCTPASALFAACGWAVRVMSARDISAAMLRPPSSGAYNLNAQAMDATVALVREVLATGRVNVQEIYVDTIGSPDIYQRKLERIFPTVRITVAKKADALFPCVSAASVAAKVTRDAALEVQWRAHQAAENAGRPEGEALMLPSAEGWGSGYPSDVRCTRWMRENMDPLFGWGNECRFSWATAKDMLDDGGRGIKVEWPEYDDEAQGARVTDFFSGKGMGAREEETSELAGWFGTPVAETVF